MHATFCGPRLIRQIGSRKTGNIVCKLSFGRPVCYYLLHELNASLKIHTEVHKDPVNAFLLVLFLFQNEHVVVEKLLQFLVGEVNAQLLKAVILIHTKAIKR